MSTYESRIKLSVDDSELNSAEKKINDLNNKKIKVDIDVDDSGIGKASKGLDDVGESAKGSMKAVNGLGQSANGLGQSMATVSKNTLTAALAYKTFNATTKQVKEAVSEVKELNDTMTTVAMTMQDITGGELSSMKSQILDMSNELSSYVDTVAQAVEIYANANESVNTIMQKAQPTVLLSTAAKMSASDSADTIQGILSQFKLADDQAMHVVDTLEALSSEMRMDFAKGIENVSQAVKVSGSVIDSAGLSFERYASIVSSVAESTRLSGSVLGNAFKTISSRIGRSKDGETTSTEKANAEKALSSIGVGIRGVDGDIQDLSITLDSLSQVWGTLTRSQQNYVAEQIAGVRQISTFKAMMDNYNRALELEKTALESNGTAMRINETRAESIDGKLQKLSATMSKMYNNAVSEDAIKGALDFANALVNVVDKLGLLQGAFSALGVAGLAKGVSLLSANWSTLVSIMTSPTAGVAMGVGAVASAYSAYNNYIKEMIENTRQSADEFATNNASLDEQISKVQELKTALASGTLSEEESYNVKSQLLDIQNQLVSSYGSQADGIDLVNGSLEKELALMNEISVANANTYLNENEKGITKATKEMNAERYYSFGSIELNEDNKSLISDLQDIAKEIDGIDLNANSGNGNMFVEFRGDTVKAKDSIDEYMTRVRQLKSEMEANGQDTSALDTLLQQASGELEKNQEILDKYQKIYNESLQADMISKGFGTDKPATIYKDYAEAIQEYNDALLSGDDSKIADAKTKFDEVQSSVDGVIEKYPEYISLFDEVGSALNTASVKANDFNKYLSNVSFSNLDSKAVEDLKNQYQEAIDKRKELYSGSNYVGNVDINNRPVVINGDGSYSTTSTSFQEKWIGDEETGSYKIIHFTPILPDGTVLDDNSLNDYIDSLFNSEDILEADKIENGGKGIVYKVDTEVNGEKITDKNLEDAFGIADAWDVDMHNLQDKMYKDEAKIKASLEQIRNDIDIQEVFKDLKDVDLKSMNFDDDVTSDSEDALAKIVDKAIELGIVSDDSSESIAEVVDILVQLGYVSSDSSSGIEKVTQSMTDLTEKTQGVVNDINAVMGVLSGQQTGKSISLADFNSDELKDYQSALEYVNGSMQLNAEKVQEITKAKADETIAINESNKALKQAEYLKNAGEIDELRSELKGLTEGTQEYNDVELRLQSLMSSNDAISAECDQYDLLTATIKEATSAYNNWLIAQSGGDYGDMFNDSLDAYARIMNTYNSKSDIYGDFGSKKFDAAVDFIVPDTVDTEDADAIKSYMDSFKQYLTFDDNGNATGMNIEQFCKNAMDKGLMVLDEAGENYQIAGETTMEDFANGLNMSLPMVQAFFDELQLKGGEFDWADEAIKTVGDLGVKAYESAEALRSIEGNSDLEIKMDVSGMDNLDDKLSTLDGTIQQMNELKAQPDVDPSQIEYANDIIQYCVAQKQKLSEPVFMTIDTSQVEGDLGEVIGLIQQLQSAKNEYDIQASVGADTTEAQGKIDNLVSQIQSKEATIQANIGDVDTTNVDTILADVSSKSAEMWLSLKVNEEAIAGYVPENKTAKVTYELDSYAVDSYNPKNLKRTVTYKIVTEGEAPKVNGTAHAEGTAHMSGTVRNNPIIGKALASGEWGVKKDETALVGELGRELVVYGNKWFTVGDNGAEFTAIPKGAIVFNHKQTEEIFRNGYVTSDGGRGHAYAEGTAYVSGGIPVSNTKTTSSKKKSSKSKSSTSKNTNTSKDKDSSSNSDTEKKFEETLDLVKIYLERQERRTEKLVNAIDDAVGLVDKQAATNKAISQVQAEIQANQKAYNTYKQKADAVGLSSDYKNKIINGQLSIETITDESLNDSIQEFQQWYDEMLACEDKIEDLKDKLKDLAQTKFDNVTTEFENQISLIEHEIKLLDLNVDQMEERGYLVSTGLYTDMIEQENENLKQLQSEYDNLKDTLDSLLDDGSIEKYSDEWYDMMGKINDVSEAIVESNTALIEYQNTIRDLEWEVFDMLQEKISSITSETEFLIDLMANEKFYDAEGKITKQGQAALGLNVANYNALMAQADEYAKERAEIEKQLEADPYNLDLAERYNELLKEQQNSIADANKALEDAISIVQDGFDAFLNTMDKAIRKRKDELNAVKDLYDYERKIAEQVKDIASLEKQLNAYQGDTSEETKATVQQLKVQLEEARQNLNETEREQYIKEVEQIWDSLYDSTEEWVNQRMDDTDWLLQQLIDYTNENAGAISDTIKEESASVGYEISDALNAIWSPGGTYSSVVSGYVDGFTSLFTTTNSVLEDIRAYMAKMVRESDKKAEESVNASTTSKNPNSSNSNSNQQQTPQKPTNNNGTGDGVPKVGDSVTFASGKYYYSSDGVSPTGSKHVGEKVYITKINSSKNAKKPYHISTGSKLGNGDLGWVSLDQIKGYKTGGLVDETGVAMLHGTKDKPELVLNSEDTKNFIELTDALRDAEKQIDLSKLVDLSADVLGREIGKVDWSDLIQSVPDFRTDYSLINRKVLDEITPRNVTNSWTIEIGDIKMEGVNDPQKFAEQLTYELKNNKNVTKIIQADTLGAIMGKNSLAKFNY